MEDWPWFWEGNVQATLACRLEESGWSVTSMADTETKAPGIDLLAIKNERWLAIEVKGYPSTTYDHGPKRGLPKPTQPATQARQWFSHALLGMMTLRNKRPDAEIAIALPDFKTYRALIDKTRLSFEMLGFGVYLVAEDDSYHLVVQHSGIENDV